MNTTSPTYTGGARSLARLALPVVVASVALAIAYVGAHLVRDTSGISGPNLFVESLSGSSISFFSGFGIIAPLGFAFAAGVASAFNPCGFAMLPAYMGLYLGTSDEGDGGRLDLQQLSKALLVGTSVTAGFVVLFAVAGAVIGFGARSAVGSILPWLGLTIGVLLTIVGSWLLAGGNMYTALAARMATHMGNPARANVGGYFVFGLSYGTASLSCTLPIFLAVVGTSFAVSSVAASFGQFVLYAAGDGFRDHGTDARHGGIQGGDVVGGPEGHALHSARWHVADDRRWQLHRLLLADPWRAAGQALIAGCFLANGFASAKLCGISPPRSSFRRKDGSSIKPFTRH